MLWPCVATCPLLSLPPSHCSSCCCKGHDSEDLPALLLWCCRALEPCHERRLRAHEHASVRPFCLCVSVLSCACVCTLPEPCLTRALEICLALPPSHLLCLCLRPPLPLCGARPCPLRLLHPPLTPIPACNCALPKPHVERASAPRAPCAPSVAHSALLPVRTPSHLLWLGLCTQSTARAHPFSRQCRRARGPARTFSYAGAGACASPPAACTRGHMNRIEA